jgi:hypothetical protein
LGKQRKVTRHQGETNVSDQETNEKKPMRKTNQPPEQQNNYP